MWLTRRTLIGLYTDESPGLKVDPVVVLVLSLVFIFSVVALHSESHLSSTANDTMFPNVSIKSLPRSAANSRAKHVIWWPK